MMRTTTKERKAIISLLDRIFVTMKKSDEELLQIEENWDKGAYRRIEGFDRDDEYSRKFFQLNLKYDFFINPNLTDADLQIITNEARTRIVRLYADSYQRFFKGFQILQKIQEDGALKALMAKVNVAKKAQEEPGGSGNGREKTEVASSAPKINFNTDSFQDEKTVSENIYENLSKKSITVANSFITLAREIYNRGSGADEKLRTRLWDTLRRLHNDMREYTDRDHIDRNVEGLVNQKIQNNKYLYEHIIQQPQQFQGPTRTLSGGVVGNPT